MGVDYVWVNIVGGPLGTTVDASATEICHGELVHLYTYPDGGSGNYTYSWTSDPAGFTSTEQNPSDYPDITTTYFVEVFDGFTTVNDQITIQVNAKPLADAGEDQIINEGTKTTLNGSGSGGSGNFSYHWEPASYLLENNIPDPQTVILYEAVLFTLVLDDENGCPSNPDQVLVSTEGPALAAFPLADPPEICLGETITVSANATGGGGEYTYLWTSDPPGFTANTAGFTDNPDVSTRYDLQLSDQYGNEFAGHINVTVNELPEIDLIPENLIPEGRDTISICVRDTVMLDAGHDDDPPGTIYFWNGNFENRYYHASTNGNWMDIQTHSVYVKHGVTGCENTGELTIIFNFDNCEISVPENKPDLSDVINLQPNPNNGDFKLTINQTITDLEAQIFDISGRLVYTEQWNGNLNSGYQIQVSTNQIEKGVYLVFLISGTRNTIHRMIVQ